MYNNYLDNKEPLKKNDTQQIFDNLKDQPPQDITNTIRTAGILTLNLSEQLQISTTNFSFIAQKLDNNENNFKVSNFQLQVPRLNINNSAISLILWNKNPYLSQSAILIDTSVISISLSNLSGILISSRELINPVQLSWIIPGSRNISNSSLLNYTGDCYYWNTTLTNWATDGCYVVYVNKTYIICNCTHLTEFSARINAVYQSNIDLFNNIQNVYSYDGLIKYRNFYIIFGSLAVIMFGLSFIGLYIDIKDFKRYYTILLNNEVINNFVKDKKIIDIYLDSNVNVVSIQNELNKPIKYTFLSILYNRILFQHTQIGAFFKFDPKMPRIFRIMLIFVGLFNSLFLTAFMYGYTYGYKDNTLESLSLLESFRLSIITAILNYPSLILLNLLMNIAGLHEFKWRYPVLIDELYRRHKYEDEISMYKSKELDEIDISKVEKIEIEDENFSLIHSIYGYWHDIISIFVCKRHAENEDRTIGSIEKAVFYAKKEYFKGNKQPYYYSFLPFHTKVGGFVFLIAVGWLIWCLNYLLLFASVHEASVSDNILTSFGFTELETVFITQPISLLGIIFIGFMLNKIKNRIGFNNKQNLELMYFNSDPYRNKFSTEFSTRFAFEIFVNIPSQVSHSLNKMPNKIKNLGYASVESVIEYIEKEEIHYSKKSHRFNKRDKSIADLYNRIVSNEKPEIDTSKTEEFFEPSQIKINIPKESTKLDYFRKKFPWKP
jgi:hypothetical protein